MNNPWIVFALCAPVFAALTDIFTKRANRELDEFSTGWLRNILAIPILLIALLVSGIPKVDPNFWKVLIAVMPLEVTVVYIYFRAVKVSPISVSAPFTAFHPIFITLGAFIILGETIKASLILPIVLLIAGAYFMNLDLSQMRNIFAPFKKLKQEKGPILMILAGLIFGINVPVGKILTGYSSPQFYAAIYFPLSGLLFTPLFITKGKDSFSNILKHSWVLIAVGAFNSLYLLTQWLANSRGPIGPISAIGKLSILITILLAGLHLKEKEILQKIIASLFMIAGAVLVVIYS
jgi:drug/metabolite transporter (DMT)-like permease